MRPPDKVGYISSAFFMIMDMKKTLPVEEGFLEA